MSEEAVALAVGLSHPFSLAYALWCAALFHLFRREGQLARERAEAVISLSTEQAFPHWLAAGTMVRDFVLIEQGQMKESTNQIGRIRAPFALALLAEAYEKVGQLEKGNAALTKALAFVDKTGERVSEAELYRLRGELTLQKFKVSSSKFQVPPSPQSLAPSTQAEAEAKACFLKAIDIARQQQAKSWELRASTSLARLWQRQGKKAEAHKLLSDVYTWFTEGFDTKDLQEAKALLESLESCV
jgi:hypothetical protein